MDKMKKIEEERKFLVDINKIPENLLIDKCKLVKQGYLDIGKDSQEKRIRMTSDKIGNEEEKYYYSEKVTLEKGREKVENPISKEKFDELRGKLDNNQKVKKLRIKINHSEKLEIYLDVFRGKLNSIVMAEIRPTSIGNTTDLYNFKQSEIPWFSKELNNSDYKQTKLLDDKISDKLKGSKKIIKKINTKVSKLLEINKQQNSN